MSLNHLAKGGSTPKTLGVPSFRSRLVDSIRTAARSFLLGDSSESTKPTEVKYKNDEIFRTCPPYGRSELAIQSAEGSLHRRIYMHMLANHPNGRVVCECDGTSRAVRACLASLNTLTDGAPIDKNHLGKVRTCAEIGTTRLNDESFYPMGKPE